LLIEQAETLGEPLEDPLLLFSVLYGFCLVNILAFNGDVACDLAAQFLALAEKQRATIPLMVGHRLVGSSSQFTGDSVASRAHYDQALALYDRTKHRSLATRFGQDIRVSILSWRSLALEMLGYPKAALADVDEALKDAREIDHAPSLMYALAITSMTYLFLGNYAAATAQTDELLAVAEEKNAPFWKAFGRTVQGCVLAEAGEASDAFTRSPPGSLHSDQREQHIGYQCACRNWRAPMRTLANSMRRGAALTKRSLRSRKPRKSGGRPRSFASLAKSRCCRASRINLTRKHISSVLSPSPANNKPNPGNSAPQ
jgi:tetratricopeptide (TPR) repeat protein